MQLMSCLPVLRHVHGGALLCGPSEALDLGMTHSSCHVARADVLQGAFAAFELANNATAQECYGVPALLWVPCN